MDAMPRYQTRQVQEHPSQLPNAGDLRRELARRGCRTTPERELIINIVREAADHPHVEEIHRRAQRAGSEISIATVYRTVKLLTELGAFVRHRFGTGRSRYALAASTPHDHLIDIDTGQVLEFRDARVVELQNRLALELGYEVVSYRLEIFGSKRERIGS
jgi:Fur family ferric uptake transcriptional regulator